MLDPKQPISDYLDDFLHGVLDEQDAARVQDWIDSSPDGKAQWESAQRRHQLLTQLPPGEASERLIRSTLEKIEMQATTRSNAGRRVVQAFLALAATALVIIGGANWHYYRLAPSPYALRLVSQNQLLADSPATLRLALWNEQTGAPVANVPVTLTMVNPRTQESVTLASFSSTADATQTPAVALPDWQGDCQLRITAHTPQGDEVLEETVQLQRSWRLLFSTDKPLYQPGQVIHMRALALRKPSLKPLAGQEATFTVADGKGNVIFKQSALTSKFGIAAVDCALANELNLGEFQLECTIGDTTTPRTVKVERYTLPKFKLSVVPDQSFYGPGDKVSGKIEAAYLFGQPVAQASVKLDVRASDGISTPIAELALKTDDQGSATFEFPLPDTLIGQPQHGGAARIRIFATVTDSAGQSYASVATRLVTSQPIVLEIIPESGTLVREQTNRIFIHASYADGQPAKVRLTINGNPNELTTNDLGVASYEVMLRDPVYGVTVVATDSQGRVGRKNVTLTTSSTSGDFVLRADKAVYRVGETMQLAASGGGVEPVFVDLLRDGQTVASQTIDMTAGSGKLAFDLPAEAAGTLELVAYRFDQQGLAVRKSRLVYVAAASDLKITAKFDHNEYRPGAKAKLTFQLHDPAGKPVPGALSLAGVDEAVFALLAQRPGLEQAFFLAEESMLQPVYAIYPGWTPERAPAAPAERDLLEQAVFSLTAYTAVGEATFSSPGWGRIQEFPFGGMAEATLPPPADDPTADAGSGYAGERTFVPVFSQPPFSLVANSYPGKVEAVELKRERGLRSVAVAWFVLFGVSLVFGVIAFAAWQPKIFMITAGVLFVLCLCGIPLILLGFAFLLGGSAEFGDLAQIGAPKAAEMKADAALGGLGMMDGEIPTGAEPAAEATTATAAPTAPPRVRRSFPETMLWRPELVTNDQGEATLELDLADSITTWRITASAVSGAGQLGSAEFPLKVFQPFFVDLDLPVALTRHDEASVRVVVYNYLDQPQSVKLALDQRPWFALLPAAAGDGAMPLEQTLELKPREVRSVYYRIKAQNVGLQQLKILATAGAVADASEREIEVVPNGVLAEFDRSDVLDTPEAPALMDVEIPSDVIPGSVKGFVKFHPSGFSQLVEGLDGIFRMPSGCFEQTSSTTYPNVLALDYLRTTKKSMPQVEAKARQYIHAGYQRLVSFEVDGGGFDWFGNPPANRTLTAYGLLEFVDMARVHDVDPRLIERTRHWLLTQQRADGSWEAEPHMLNDGLAGSVNRGDDVTLAASAYISWAIFHSLPKSRGMLAAPPRPEYAKALDYLLAHRAETISDPYVLATVALAIASYDPRHPELPPYLARLESLKQPQGKGFYWAQPAGAPRPFHGGGAAGDVETTATAALALLTAKQYAATARGALVWLATNKDSSGTWHNTQATVLALKALILGTQPNATGKERRFEIKVNDTLAQTLVVSDTQADVLQQVDISHLLIRVGEINKVSVAELTDTATSFQTVIRYHRERRATDAPPEMKEPLSIALAYDRARLNVDETVTVTATIVNQAAKAAPMVVLDLPIPGGFTIERGEMDELAGSKQIAKYQVTPRQAIVYLRELAPGQKIELRYRLKATLPVKVAVPPGQVYEYYNPDRRGTSAPAQLEALKT